MAVVDYLYFSMFRMLFSSLMKELEELRTSWLLQRAVCKESEFRPNRLNWSRLASTCLSEEWLSSSLLRESEKSD
jgi:hypothetical protein